MATKKKEVNQVVSPDDTMEEPKTKDYSGPQQDPVEANSASQQSQTEVFIKIQDAFREDLNKTIGELGYNRELGSPEMHVQVFQIFDVLDKTKGKYLTEDQANQLISMVARAPYNVIAEVMKNIAENQANYFTVVTRAQIEEEAKKASEAEVNA